MKKVLTIVLIIILLVASVFVLTGCNKGVGKAAGRNTTEISYSAPSIYSIKLNVPVNKNDAGEEEPVYEFTEELPEAVEDLLYKSGTYLVGDKVVATIETTSYTYQTGVAYKEEHGDVTPSFESFKEFIFADDSTSTLQKSEETKIGDREALKDEYRIGSGSGDLYGYRYIINIDDIYPRGYMTITFVTADGSSESAEATFADAEVQAMIDSISINGLE